MTQFNLSADDAKALALVGANGRAVSDIQITDAVCSMVVNYWTNKGNPKAAADVLKTVEGVITSKDFATVRGFFGKFIGIAVKKDIKDGKPTPVVDADGKACYEKSQSKEDKILSNYGVMNAEDMATEIEGILQLHLDALGGTIFGRITKTKVVLTDAEEKSKAAEQLSAKLDAAFAKGLSLAEVMKIIQSGKYAAACVIAQQKTK